MPRREVAAHAGRRVRALQLVSIASAVGLYRYQPLQEAEEQEALVRSAPPTGRAPVELELPEAPRQPVASPSSRQRTPASPKRAKNPARS